MVAGTSEFRPIDYMVQLPFAIDNTSPYVCQKCKANLNAWFVAWDKMRKLEKELKELHLKVGYLCKKNDVFNNVQNLCKDETQDQKCYNS